ncbi:MAG: DNA-protecting protein DprA [Anaerolineae bacterium]|nr:MAG: DNA-protecting protein DprA [Anaerolineae bacterium]
MSDERKYWVGFNLVKGIGAVRLQGLLDAFDGDLQAAWNAPPQALRAAGLSDLLVERLLAVRQAVSLDRIWENIQNQAIQVLTWNDEAYPRRLREITQPPPVLYLRGTLTPEDEWAVAVVGTRRVTAYGRQVCEQICDTLARNGITVVSGLARGVDGIAHKTALESGGRTLAVLGCGVDRIYPPEHRKLAAAIVEHGALLSDYPLGTPPEARNFPPRNRIISGLSLATVVVEAGERSGALITAEFAAEQGREVFAVPGNIFAPQSRGPNRLLQQGAHPLLHPDEILEVLELSLVTEYRQARLALPENETEVQILRVLGSEPLHVDEIRLRLNLPIETITATLTLMELKGMVRQAGGMRYYAVGEATAPYRTEDERH